MKCKKCKTEVLDNTTFCPNCGSKIKKKLKISVVTIIGFILSIIITSLSLFIVIGLIVGGSKATDPNVGGWAVIAAMILAIPLSVATFYYYIISFISLGLDIAAKNTLTKNIIFGVLLLLPIFVISIYYISNMIESNSPYYKIKDATITIPEDMKKESFRASGNDIKEPYSQVGFVYRDNNKNECYMYFGAHVYDDRLDYNENLKLSVEYNIYDTEGNQVRDIYDATKELKKKDIKGKEWVIYEDQFGDLYYKIYGTYIDGYLYKIEIADETEDHTKCLELENEVINSFKSKK